MASEPVQNCVRTKALASAGIGYSPSVQVNPLTVVVAVTHVAFGFKVLKVLLFELLKVPPQPAS